ncbi:helix-turn-helix transcriptional regulator [Candidatus Deianiraea vastatrix]|uniref:DNA-binding protein n=1 Tax=Candidatus Deianiraea vastatrix TaxID=2163644 RepID=A0A5B8XD47_9RICK|nr:helix-turn-helix domain-containing protein [Candidatus Deianiraea vastatrix]QED22946.1 Putative DNA-binding protein [Candidatus Deianiraea vastatrix]
MTLCLDKIQPNKLVGCDEAAKILNVKVQTLAKWRCNKSVYLPYVKIGSRRVCYYLSDLMNFCQRIESNSENHSSI